MLSDFVEVEEEFEEEAEEESEGVDERKAKKEPKKKVPLFKLQAKNSKNVSTQTVEITNPTKFIQNLPYFLSLGLSEGFM